jgi:hypothetical protein
LGVLEALFERIEGRWFSQRQTVSVAFESGPSEVSMGSVHMVHAQGISDPYFCDSHTDELKAGTRFPANLGRAVQFVSLTVVVTMHAAARARWGGGGRRQRQE